MYVDEDDINERIVISARLRAALKITAVGERVSGGVVTAKLAPKLQIDPDRLGDDGEWLLRRIAGELNTLLEEPSQDFIHVTESGRAQQIAVAVTERPAVDVLVRCLSEFGWVTLREPIQRVTEIESVLRQKLENELTEKLIKMLHEWERAGIWSRGGEIGILTPRRSH